MESSLTDKYQLKDLFKQIDLLDRKIAHCQNYEHFEIEGERTKALSKLTKARDLLVRKTDTLTKSGLTSDPKDLPRSFKNATQSARQEAA